MLIAKPNTFSAGATILSAEHNENFDTVYNLVNGNIENDNIKSSAAIVDTKLAQITTASKVSGTSLTGLASTPSGAGSLPIANIPYKDEDDMTSDSATHVPTQQSVKKYVDDTVKVLATWGSVSTSTSAIQATTDGFVVGCWISTVNDAGISGTFKTDANATPTTVRTQCALGGGSAVDIGSKFPFCCPVKKDDYYLVEGSSMTVSHYFIPLS